MASTLTASVTYPPANLPKPAGATAVRRRGTSYFSRKFRVCVSYSPRQYSARKGLLADAFPISPFLEEGFLSFLFWVLDCVSEFGPLFWPLCAHRYVFSKTKFCTLSKTKQKDEFVCKAYDLQNRETQGCGSNKFPVSY